MIKLRKLKEKDIPFMLEWMRDEETQHIFQKNMSTITEEQARSFVTGSVNVVENGCSLNYAVVDDLDDEYLGTISLKELDLKNLNAEYAVSFRKCARGNGVALVATNLLLDKAFNELGLHRVYLNVLTTNIRANKFYEKVGFKFEGTSRGILWHEGEFKDLNWYAMTENEFITPIDCVRLCQ